MHHLVVVHLVSAQSLQKFGRGIYIEHKSWCGRVRSACHILWQEVNLQEMLPLETMHVFEGLHNSSNTKHCLVCMFANFANPGAK